MTKKEKDEEPKTFDSSISTPVRRAKKDFEIHQNEVHISIKTGDDIDSLNIPKRFFPNLETENVI